MHLVLLHKRLLTARSQYAFISFLNGVCFFILNCTTALSWPSTFKLMCSDSPPFASYTTSGNKINFIHFSIINTHALTKIRLISSQNKNKFRIHQNSLEMCICVEYNKFPVYNDATVMARLFRDDEQL